MSYDHQAGVLGEGPTAAGHHLVLPDTLNFLDMWLALVRHRREIVITFFVVLVVGVTTVFLWPPEFAYTTTIEIGSQSSAETGDGKTRPIEEPENVKAKLESSYIPLVQSRYALTHPDDDSRYKMTVKVPDTSSVAILHSTGWDEDEEVYLDLQAQVRDALIGDHERIISEIRKGLELERLEAENKFVALRDEADGTVDLLKRFERHEQLLNAHIEKLSEIIHAAHQSRESVVAGGDPNAQAMTLLVIDNQITASRDQLRSLEERLYISIPNNRDKLTRELAELRRAQNAQRERIAEIETRIANLSKTRSVVPPMRSLWPLGLTTAERLLLIPPLALVLAVMAGLVAELRLRASERIQGRIQQRLHWNGADDL